MSGQRKSRPLFTAGKDPVPIVQEAGWAPGPVWTSVENVTPPGFDPRTVQSLANHYTDYATRATSLRMSGAIFPPPIRLHEVKRYKFNFVQRDMNKEIPTDITAHKCAVLLPAVSQEWKNNAIICMKKDT